MSAPATTAEGDSYYIGQRLSLQAHTCTIRYIGSLPGTSGTWLGVEWDDPRHGKHDGMHDGIRYFTTISTSLTSASFVRPTRPHDEHRAFLTAVKEKYATDAASYFTVPLTAVPDAERRNPHGLATSPNAKAVNGGITPVRFGSKVAEEVGFAKVAAQQANLHALKIVVLGGWQVSGLSTRKGVDENEEDRVKLVTEVAETLRCLTELDLSRNLIEKWSSVVEICAGLKGLRALKLSMNRFRDLAIPKTISPPNAFNGITDLSLDAVLLPWRTVVPLVEQFASITKFSFASNNVHSIDMPLSCPSIETLDLSFNTFTDIYTLSPLSNLPSLTTLLLQSNGINMLSLPTSTTFTTLLTLDLAGNALPTFSSLNLLTSSSFPVLSAVRLSKNPLFTAEPPDTAHMLCIAVLPGLRMLNYSPVDATERLNAELYYLSRVAADLRLTKPGTLDEERILATHPQFRRLVAKHEYESQLQDRQPQDAKYAPGTLGARIITLSISRSRDGPLETDTKMIQVPRTVSIYELKSIVGRRFGIVPARFRLIWETGEWDPVDNSKHNSEDDRYSIDSESENSNEAGTGNLGSAGMEERGRWVRREVIVQEGTSSVGFWVDGDPAMLRLEVVDPKNTIK